ncbi:helix-turn-helix domain-containing protein [Mycobacterium sp. ITM-2016-00316]|uniref:helix-turn-helix domain-containing protein n=1 Tax=Mycobacterium sp. ITM-2016-00316 TaxID=2099695 RepID=UPI001E644D6F|nr:helix-turn-helix domain-containing protein [Mycobacterium sp. ITM-2016-00316]WNG80941.1 helix-turn-helix domain-containing protein [Mycobacterium sp. ITM-2016-00316]
MGALDKPDNSVAAEPAHLLDPAHRAAIHMSRPVASPEFAGLIRRFWLPVWQVPPGEVYTQRVLQYPVCLLVVTADYARFYGPATGLTGTPLSGDGWAAGVMFEPAAGTLLTGGEVTRWTDGHVEVAEVLGAAGVVLAEQIRTTMASDPVAAQTQSAVVEHYHDFLRGYLPVDGQGLLVNEVVSYVEDNPEVNRVADVCARFAIGERSLQRLIRHRVGLTPKWLVRRRRIQDATWRLRTGATTIAALAADLGYADEAHLSRDFRRVTGMTPGAFAARYAD